MRTKVSIIIKDNENLVDLIQAMMESMAGPDDEVTRYEVNQNGAPIYPFPVGEYEDGEEG